MSDTLSPAAQERMMELRAITGDDETKKRIDAILGAQQKYEEAASVARDAIAEQQALKAENDAAAVKLDSREQMVTENEKRLATAWEVLNKEKTAFSDVRETAQGQHNDKETELADRETRVGIREGSIDSREPAVAAREAQAEALLASLNLRHENLQAALDSDVRLVPETAGIILRPLSIREVPEPVTADPDTETHEPE